MPRHILQDAFDMLGAQGVLTPQIYNSMMSQASAQGHPGPEEHQRHRHGISKIFHNIEKRAIRPIAHTISPVLPVITGLAGNAFLGPIGGAIGGAVGGAAQRKGNTAGNVAKGAGIGILTSLAAPLLGNIFGVQSSGIMGKTLGLQGPLGHLGQGLFGNGAGAVRAGHMQSLGKIGQGGGRSGLGVLSTILGGRGNATQAHEQGFISRLGDQLTGDPLNAVLMGLTGAGALFGRRSEREMRQRAPGMNESIEDIMQREGYGRRRETLPNLRSRTHQRQTVSSPQTERERQEGKLSQFFDEVNPNTEYYAKGGYIDGDDSGQSDEVDINLPEGSYVWNATDLSLIGDGNSRAGAKQLKQLNDKFEKSGFVSVSKGGTIKARVSPGEFIMSPKAVTGIGKGDNRRGAKEIEKVRKNIRKHKGVKSILPPKTKPLERYF